MARRSRRSWKPEVARLESRDVPTVVSPLAFGAAGLRAAQAETRALDKVGSVGTTPESSATSTANPQASASNYLDPATLTPKGLSEARFKAVTKGPYAVSTPIFNTQTRNVTIIGNIVSNQFLHGTLVMHIEIGKDGTAQGFAALRNRNVAATGTILVIDLGLNAPNVLGTGQGVPSTFDSLGRPITLGWNVDSNGSAGSYADGIGEGTLTISYTANGHSKNSAGGANVSFNGLILQSGVADLTSYTLPKFN